MTQRPVPPLPAVPIQTVNETSHRLKEFRLRFYASDTIIQPPQEVRLPPRCPIIAVLFERGRVWGHVEGGARRRRGRRRKRGTPPPRTLQSCLQCCSPQVADEYLRGVLTEAAATVHGEPVPDVMTMLHKGGDFIISDSKTLYEGQLSYLDVWCARRGRG